MPPVNEEEETIFPDVGLWISVTRNNFEFLYKIIKHEYRNMVKVAVTRNDMGFSCVLDESFFWDLKWKYIEEPSDEEVVEVNGKSPQRQSSTKKR